MKRVSKKLLCTVLAIAMCIICLPFTMASAAVAPQIPSDAVNFNGHYYKAYDISKSWTDAKSYCENLGGHLVTITSQEEQVFIESTFLSNSPKMWFYLAGGYRENTKSSEWFWVTGEEFVFTNWMGLNESQQDVAGHIYIWLISSSAPESFVDWGKVYNLPDYKWLSHTNYCSDSVFNSNYTGFICEWDSTSTYEIYGREFNNNLDYYAKELDSSTYDPTLANMMAALSAAVYSKEDIESAYTSLGFEYCSLFDYGASTTWDECGYALAFKKSEFGI